MPISQQKILPAVKKTKDLEELLHSSFEYIVLLDCHLSQLQQMVTMSKEAGKKLLIHADLIQGLKTDDYASEFLCQKIRPAGIISTRANMIIKAKQNKILSVQRLFLIDSNALNKSYALLKRTQPDFIEVLPGIMPHIIKEVRLETGIPIFAGGLIRTIADIENALEAGAEGVTTSVKQLWKPHEFKEGGL